jgi:hypothetical protein
LVKKYRGGSDDLRELKIGESEKSEAVQTVKNVGTNPKIRQVTGMQCLDIFVGPTVHAGVGDHMQA